MTKRWNAAPVIGVTLLLAACSGTTDEADGTAEPVALVKLAEARAGTIAGTTTLYGAAELSSGSKLALVAPVEGTLVAIEAPAGTPVQAGQVVARLAPSPTTRLDLAKAASDARAADLALARAQRLRADGLGSNVEVETARAAAQSAGLTRASLAQRSGGLVIRAPAAGVIDAVTPSPGSLVPAGGDVASISRPSPLRARFGVDPAVARGLRPGTPLRIDTGAGRSGLTVPIEAVAPTIDPQTRLISVYARLPGASGVTAGQTLSAGVATPQADAANGVSVPYAALLDDAGQPYVFVVAAGIAHRHDVTVIASQGDRAAVSGIGPGDAVVIAGGTAVEDGMKVRTR